MRFVRETQPCVEKTFISWIWWKRRMRFAHETHPSSPPNPSNVGCILRKCVCRCCAKRRRDAVCRRRNVCGCCAARRRVSSMLCGASMPCRMCRHCNRRRCCAECRQVSSTLCNVYHCYNLEDDIFIGAKITDTTMEIARLGGTKIETFAKTSMERDSILDRLKKQWCSIDVFAEVSILNRLKFPWCSIDVFAEVSILDRLKFPWCSIDAFAEVSILDRLKNHGVPSMFLQKFRFWTD